MDHDPVNHPRHYTNGFLTRPIECIDITRHMGFCSGNAFKYEWRAGKKGGREKLIEDLEKALFYLHDIYNPYGCYVYGTEHYTAMSHFGQVEEPVEDNNKGLNAWKAYQVLKDIVSGNYATAIDKLEAILREERAVV